MVNFINSIFLGQIFPTKFFQSSLLNLYLSFEYACDFHMYFNYKMRISLAFKKKKKNREYISYILRTHASLIKLN